MTTTSSEPSSSRAVDLRSPAPPGSGEIPTANTPPFRARRKHREGQIQAAYTLQRDAAIKGAVTWGTGGAAAIFVSHHLFPKFRSQTLAFKGFLASSFVIFGLVVGADTVLLDHEGQQRSSENLIRARARTELGRQGILASESEIQRWKEATIARLEREENAKAGK